MTQEEKDLLLKDLCARLPYSVIIEVDYLCNKDWQSKYPSNKEVDTLKTIDLNEELVITNGYSSYNIEEIKPYLRSMSDMTKEEEVEWFESVVPTMDCDKQLDFYCKYHFDYRGLIKKGLALEAPDGMYIIKRKTI